MGVYRAFGAIVGGYKKNESQKNHVRQLEITDNQTKGLRLIHQSPSKNTVASIIKETKFYWSKNESWSEAEEREEECGCHDSLIRVCRDILL